MRSRLLLFAVITWWSVLGGTFAWAALDDPSTRTAQGSVGSFRDLAHHALLRPRPRVRRAEVAVDASGLELGDVIIGAVPDTDYGYFSHITAVMGPGETIGHHIAYGVFVRPVAELTGYDDVRVLRAELSDAQRAEIARFLRSLVGGKFNLMPGKRDPRSWNCAKSIWQAYARVGLDLVPDRDFLTPDDIARSPLLHQVAVWRPR